MPSAEYLALGERCFLKRLEFPAVYDRDADDLYEVDTEGFAELAVCDGTLERSEAAFPPEFLEYCLEEGVLELQESPARRDVTPGINEVPSLRYLLVEITGECNLACRHCYLGDAAGDVMPPADFERLAAEFEEMGGLRLMVTGGEPLTHPEFERINGIVSERAFRAVLVTNGTLLDDEVAGGLGFQEVQVSLDGMREAHEALRGLGSFEAAMSGIGSLRRAGRSLSVATMLHTAAMGGLDDLEKLVREVGAISWTLDVPCEAGRLKGDPERLIPPPGEAARELDRAFGSEQHVPSGDYACGAHLARVTPSGLLTKCGFYGAEWSGGYAREGLRGAWTALEKVRRDRLECDCPHVQDCGGGCRYRAETTAGRYAPDPVKCFQFGVEPH